jgi:PAS domain S-box-containing protein
VRAWALRKPADPELEQSERRFRALTEKSADLITITDAQGVIIYDTPNVQPTLGYQPGETIGHSLFEFAHPDDVALVQAAFQEIVKQPGAVRQIEARVRAQHGSWRWLAAVLTNLLDDPAVQGVVLNSRDTTERREAEETLAESERRFRALTEKAAGDIILLDAAGKVTYETPQESSLLGYAPGDLAGHSGFELIHPDDLAAGRHMFAEALRAPGNSTRGELRLRHKDGGWGWIRCRATNLLHEPAVRAVVLNLHNVTDLKEAEAALSRLNTTLELQVAQRTEALRESEANFRGYFENVAVGASQTNADGRFILVNDRFCAITGYSREELLAGMTPADLNHPEERYVDQEGIASVRGGDRYDVEKRYLTKDGRVVWVHVTVSPVLDAGGRFRSTAAVIEDITDRKRAEQALTELNETLERRVADRTSDLRDRSERLALLSDAAGALLTARDPLLFLDEIYARLSELLGLELYAHWEAAPGGDHLRLAVSRGLPEEIAAQIRHVALGQGICGRVAQTRQRMVVEDVQHSTDERITLIRSVGITAYVCYPLIAKGTLLGTLSFGTRRRNSFDSGALALIQAVCNQVATAIERQHAEAALRAARDELERRVDERTAELARTNERLLSEIAEHEKAEIALQSQATLLDMASDAIFAWNLDGPITYWNQGAERLYGFTPQEAVGRVGHELLAAEHEQGLDAFLKPLLQHGEWTGELTHTTKGGRRLIVESRMKLLDKPDGRRLVIETNRDLTERLKLQGEIVAASERERERLGHDLHDGLCQILIGARLKTESLVGHIAQGSPESSQRAQVVAGLVAQALEESRNLARGLEPVSDEPEGLTAALHQLADSTSRLFGVACTFTVSDPALVTNHNAASELFRIAQEATSNAIKHGHPSTISIRLSRDAEGVHLRVINDGTAFPSRPSSEGMGLKTMRFRAGRIGAMLSIQAGGGGGSVVQCTLPFTTGGLQAGADSAPELARHYAQDDLWSQQNPVNPEKGPDL